MHKLVAILLSLIMVIALFAGCQQTTSSSSSSDSKGETDPNFIYDGDSPIVEEPETVTMICAAGGSSINYSNVEDMSWIQAIIEKSGLDMQIDCLDSASYNDNIRPRLAAGTDLPDIVQVPGLDQDMTYANSGVFLELTDLYDKYAYNLKWRFESNPTVEAQSTTPDGKKFYIPGMDMAIDYCPALMYNHFWLDELGLEAPSTTDEFYDMLVAMKGVDFNGNGEADEVPMFIQTAYMKNLFTSWGVDAENGYFVNEDGIVEPSYISERYLEALKFFKRLYDEELITRDFASISSDMQTQMSTNNQFGVVVRYLNNCHVLSLNYYTGLGVDWDTSYGDLAWVPLEAPLEGPYGHKLYVGNNPIFGYWAIAADTKVPELAFAFCDYLYSEEANNFLYYGVYENGDYEIRDGKIYPDLAKRSEDDYATKQGNNFGGFPRILLAAHRDVSYNYTIGDYNEILNDYYQLPTPATFGTEEELDTITMYSTDLQTYWNEAFTAFVTGTRDLSEWDSYCDTLLSMGYEEMVAVKQAQYDRIYGD